MGQGGFWAWIVEYQDHLVSQGDLVSGMDGLFHFYRDAVEESSVAAAQVFEPILGAAAHQDSEGLSQRMEQRGLVTPALVRPERERALARRVSVHRPAWPPTPAAVAPISTILSAYFAAGILPVITS